MVPLIINTDKKTKNLFKLHRISKLWISDITFYFDEYRFYQDLIAMFFIDLLDETYFVKVREAEAKLTVASKKANLLLFEILTHEKQLATLLESEHLKGEKEFRMKHRALAKQFEQLLQDNKALKQLFFKLIKKPLKRHKQKLLPVHANLAG